MEILLRCFGFTAHMQVGREEDPDVLVETESETEIATAVTDPAVGFARH